MALSPQPSAVRNRLLAALPPDVLAQFLPKLRSVSLPLRKILNVPGEPIEAVYFVESGWVSMVTHLDEGAQAEVGLIGQEGFVGASIATGIDTAFAEAYVQAPGEALQMETKAFQRELDMHPALFRRLLRYTEAMHAQTMQTAACNGRHALEQRLARWILMARDRADSDDLPLTQEFLALMLCVHRPSITVVARMLQQAGIIRYSQGRITVLDRDGLEATACECYRAVRARFDQILG
jgi:CRP-like cAMP-binding protein